MYKNPYTYFNMKNKYNCGDFVQVEPKCGPLGGHEFQGRIQSVVLDYKGSIVYTVIDQDDDAFDVEEDEITEVIGDETVEIIERV